MRAPGPGPGASEGVIHRVLPQAPAPHPRPHARPTRGRMPAPPAALRAPRTQPCARPGPGRTSTPGPGRHRARTGGTRDSDTLIQRNRPTESRSAGRTPQGLRQQGRARLRSAKPVREQGTVCVRMFSHKQGPVEQFGVLATLSRWRPRVQIPSGPLRLGSSVGTSDRLKSGRSPVRPRPQPPHDEGSVSSGSRTLRRSRFSTGVLPFPPVFSRSPPVFRPCSAVRHAVRHAVTGTAPGRGPPRPPGVPRPPPRVSRRRSHAPPAPPGPGTRRAPRP